MLAQVGDMWPSKGLAEQLIFIQLMRPGIRCYRLPVLQQFDVSNRGLELARAQAAQGLLFSTCVFIWFEALGSADKYA